MLDHTNHYVTIFFHYLFYLILVGLISFSFTYIIDEPKDSSLKTRMNQTDRLIIEASENYP